MKQLHTKAIVLKRLNFSEADRIITVITPEQGRLSMLAKGVRKQKSKLAGGLELFSESDITYIDGRSELKTIVSTRLNSHFSTIVADIQKTMLAYEILQTVNETTQHGVEPGTYEVLRSSLVYLNELNSHMNLVLLWFTVHSLIINGSGLNIEKPLNRRSFEENSNYQYSYDDRSFVATEQGPYRPVHIKLLRLASRADTPKKLEAIQQYETLSEDVASLMKNILKMHKT